MLGPGYTSRNRPTEPIWAGSNDLSRSPRLALLWTTQSIPWAAAAIQVHRDIQGGNIVTHCRELSGGTWLGRCSLHGMTLWPADNWRYARSVLRHDHSRALLRNLQNSDHSAGIRQTPAKAA